MDEIKQVWDYVQSIPIEYHLIAVGLITFFNCLVHKSMELKHAKEQIREDKIKNQLERLVLMPKTNPHIDDINFN